jgi:hypothetical protein
VIGTIKTRREGLGLRFGREINGHEDCIFVMVVFVPDGLVLIGVKPRTYFDHRCGKFSIAYPDRDAVHSPLHAFVEATMAALQLSGQGLLTNIKGSLDLKGGISAAGAAPRFKLSSP